MLSFKIKVLQEGNCSSWLKGRTNDQILQVKGLATWQVLRHAIRTCLQAVILTSTHFASSFSVGGCTCSLAERHCCMIILTDEHSLATEPVAVAIPAKLSPKNIIYRLFIACSSFTTHLMKTCYSHNLFMKTIFDNSHFIFKFLVREHFCALKTCHMQL